MENCKEDCCHEEDHFDMSEKMLNLSHEAWSELMKEKMKKVLEKERGHIMEYRVLTLRSNSEQVSIPITSQHVPNIHVSVFIVKGQGETNPLASFKLGYASLPVSPREKELRITLSPDRDTYRPGEAAAMVFG